MAGSTGSSTSVTYTGDPYIDGMLGGTQWAGTGITYSFPTSNGEYSYGTEKDTFQPVSPDVETAVKRALDTSNGNSADDGFSVEGFTNLAISETTGPGANLRYAQSDDPSTAWAYYPGDWAGAGDVWFGTSYSYMSPVTGDYASHTILHETGHALGLKHSQDSPAVPSDMDSMEYTVMSYRSYENAPLTGYVNEAYGYAQTWMMLDIAALQSMYGANFNVNSGDTVYSWDPSSGDTLVNGVVAISPGANRIFATIWDGGGVDTYDLSAYSTDLTINLAPGGFSLFSSSQLAALKWDGTEMASGNIYNALQYQGDDRSLIENAIGGSGNDTISGNTARNLLQGRGGDDVLMGLKGRDTLKGGAGKDTLKGGSGADTLVGGGRGDVLRGGGGNDVLKGGAGRDKLVGNKGRDEFHFGLDDGKDKVRDFADDTDSLVLYEALWGGGLTVKQVIATYATDIGGDVVFDFGGGDILTVQNITTTLLENDIVLV